MDGITYEGIPPFVLLRSECQPHLAETRHLPRDAVHEVLESLVCIQVVVVLIRMSGSVQCGGSKLKVLSHLEVESGELGGLDERKVLLKVWSVFNSRLHRWLLIPR